MNNFYQRYTNTLQLDNDCNYLDPEKSPSKDFILSCINKPSINNPLNYEKCLNISQNDGWKIDGESIKENIHWENILKDTENKKIDSIEGFSNDYSSRGSGVSYVPLGDCHDGYFKDENGECNLQSWRGRYRDGDWIRGHNVETMHADKKIYSICGEDNFKGLSNGYIMCEKVSKE